MLTELKPVSLPVQEKEVAAVMSKDGKTMVTPAVKHSKSQKEAVERNSAAVSSFYTAFKDLEDMDCLSNLLDSIDGEWPTGKSWVVVKELLDEFAPKNLMGKVEQRRELDRVTMGKWEDPKKLFSRIVDVEARCKDRGCAVTEEDKMAVVLIKSPEQYMSLI